MSTRQHVRLEIGRTNDGRWSWRYVDPSRSVDLAANTTYSSADEAASSARRAYPDVEDVLLPPSPNGSADDVDSRNRLVRLLIALALFVLFFETLRRLGR